MGSDLGNGATTATQDRFAGQLGYRGGRRDTDPMTGEPDLGPRGADRESPLGTRVELGPHNGEPVSRPSLADLDALNEPVFPTGWLDPATGSLADHPLLRGLLMELPPKGTMPGPGWLDRWFEAARSILELLYLQDTTRR